MTALQMFSAIGLPVLMVVGAVMAWRHSKQQDVQDTHAPTWRDDSLDDWRKERDAAARQEREGRTTHATTGEGSTEEKKQEKTHQRIGG